VCGFGDYMGIEISVPKVEAISVFNSQIMYDSPFITLHDWDWDWDWNECPPDTILG
jgi:hypothetical protein